VRAFIRLVFAITLLLSAGFAHAADSPQFRGPDRTGIFPETGLLKAWPEGGPPLAWKATSLGVGYTSAVVSAGKVYVTGTLADQESSVFIFDLEGKPLGQIPYGKETTAEMAPGARSTPTIVKDRMYLLSGLGVISCIDLTASKVAWQVNILERFKAPNNEWSLAEALLVEDGKVYCTPGGPDAAMAALDAKTGDTLWVTTGLTDMAAYVPPLLVNHNGRKVIFTETSKYVICVDATTGQLLWKHDHPTQYDIHGVTPIYKDGLLYYVGGYKSGGGQLKLSQDASSYEVVWQDHRTRLPAPRRRAHRRLPLRRVAPPGRRQDDLSRLAGGRAQVGHARRYAGGHHRRRRHALHLRGPQARHRQPLEAQPHGA
jgi:outer membrane protein assembly factor BamB